MAQNNILGIVHTHANRVLHCATEMYCQKLTARGYNAHIVDLADPEWIRHMGHLLRYREVAFAFGLQGIGSRLEDSEGENLWLAAKVPFLCLHHDNPCYNPINHANDSPYVANMYFYPSFLELKQRYLAGAQISALLPLELLDIPAPPRIPFADRPIKLLFLKGGAPLDPMEEQLRHLPKSLHDGIRDQLRQATRNPNLQICDLIQEVFDRLKLDREDHHKTFWGIAQVMDIWLRRKRALDFVDWLKFQDGAVIVGDGWDFIDRTGARAAFRTGVPAINTVQLYEQAQFTCNTNPYGRDIVHERILYGMLMGGCVLSDGNAWLDQTLDSVPALTRFRWDQPLDDQLRPALSDLSAAALNAAAGRDAIIARYKPDKLIEVMIDSAHQIAVTLDQFAREKTTGS